MTSSTPATREATTPSESTTSTWKRYETAGYWSLAGYLGMFLVAARIHPGQVVDPQTNKINTAFMKTRQSRILMWGAAILPFAVQFIRSNVLEDNKTK